MWLTGLGGPERIERRTGQTSAPGTGRVLVRMEASGVSFAEVQMLRGSYPLQPRFPFVPGYDLVGTVAETGAGVPGSLAGTRVAALTRTGAWREYVDVPAKHLVTVPDGLPAPDAEALITNGVTAYQMLHRVAKVHRGGTVLVHGAGGGVGSLLTQLAVRHGVRVLGTASAAKQDALLGVGAEPIDYRAGPVPDAVRRLAPGGVDAVFDHLGVESLTDSWRMLAAGGTVVTYGSLGTLGAGQVRGYLLPLAARMIGWNAAGLRDGRRLRLYYVRPDAAFRTDLAELFSLAATGQLTPQVAGTYPLERAADALGRLVDGKVTGKLVLVR
jgi:NADPH2:quinone reductase